MEIDIDTKQTISQYNQNQSKSPKSKENGQKQKFTQDQIDKMIEKQKKDHKFKKRKQRFEEANKVEKELETKNP